MLKRSGELPYVPFFRNSDLMVMGRYGLKKEERLSGKKQMEKLFREGKSFFLSPFRVVVLEEAGHNGRPPVRMAITVPRKLFRRAVKRNLIKRRVKEAYRLNKSLLADPLQEKGVNMDVIFIYTSPEILSSRDIEDKIVLSLQKILRDYEKSAH